MPDRHRPDEMPDASPPPPATAGRRPTPGPGQLVVNHHELGDARGDRREAAAPTVYRVAPQRLVLSLVRLGLAAVGFASSVVAGADGDAAGVGLALGAGVACLALLTDRRWLLLGGPSFAPLPGDARRAPLTRAVGSGMLPSTAGVAALAAVSLAFEPILASVLAGILAGMGIVSLASWVEVVLWERREGARLFADADVHTRRYVAPLAQPTSAAARGGK